MLKKGRKAIIIKPVDGAPLLGKVTGLATIEPGKVPFVRNRSSNVLYVLEGKLEEPGKLHGKVITVFGRLKVPRPAAIDRTPVKFNIEIRSITIEEN
jgi:starvation-inducible outer membrane lipoprotein